jgi:hypothetical protein
VGASFPPTDTGTPMVRDRHALITGLWFEGGTHTGQIIVFLHQKHLVQN